MFSLINSLMHLLNHCQRPYFTFFYRRLVSPMVLPSCGPYKKVILAILTSTSTSITIDPLCTSKSIFVIKAILATTSLLVYAFVDILATTKFIKQYNNKSEHLTHNTQTRSYNDQITTT
ncbi:Uncharacterized protein TCM_044768 [Theobroma cacao]|uniref:Uncharacterized protein n=1 Tax=Theobroma cacao TaxID=3641 RepID=A0A061FQP8_THECC|nr:Uncharacterized protein TCM_044768 [Theobroma cacao]